MELKCMPLLFYPPAKVGPWKTYQDGDSRGRKNLTSIPERNINTHTLGEEGDKDVYMMHLLYLVFMK